VPPPIDPLGRRLTHLRLSVTQRCDLACAYCHREGAPSTGPEMSLPLLTEIVTTLARFGLDKVKLTGGEPLVRADLPAIVAVLRAAGYKDLSLTTNGTRLAELARPLAAAGLQRVNIGCDSLSSSVTPKSLQRVLPGLEAAVAAGLVPVKLNMVVLRDVNEHEIDELIAVAGAHGAILQLIELIATSDSDRFFRAHHVPLGPVRDRLAARASARRVRELQGREQFDVDGATVEIVSPFQHSFCGRCSKLRVTADGCLMPCLVAGVKVPWRGEASVYEALALRRLPDRVGACE
jgi:cyclic pyranopterin phosphate synthase